MNGKNKRWLTAGLALLTAAMAWANDGVFYVNGNQLVPIHETDIAVSKEILTIGIGDDGFASVDVYYEFLNPTTEKTIEMGFEAAAPYNESNIDLSREGIHPEIFDFTATMNGQPMALRNAVVFTSAYGETTDLSVPADLTKWEISDDYGCGDVLYNAELDSLTGFAYVYYFTATFKPGRNIVRHTYRYRMSEGVLRTFEIPYWLTPAMRWANRQIDDFTLRIKAEDTAKHFYIADSLLTTRPFTVTEGQGKVRTVHRGDDDYLGRYVEVSLRNGTIEWHAEAFRPEQDIWIVSADLLESLSETTGGPTQFFYDRSDNYYPFIFREGKFGKQEAELRQRVIRNLPYADRGYVFKDPALQRVFEQQWWYMPDPAWRPSPDSFSPHEWEIINEKE